MLRLRTVLLNAAAEGATGSAAAPAAPAESAPAATQAEAPAALPVKHKTFAERSEHKRRSAGELKTWLAEQKAQKPAPDNAAKPAASNAATIDAAPTEAAKAASEAIAEEGGKVPTQRKGESDAKYEARLVEAAHKLRDAEALTKSEREARTAAEEKATTFEKEIADFKKKFAKIKNPETLLEAFEELTGYSYEKLTRDIVDGVVKPKGQAVKLPPEVQERMDRLEAESKRLAEIEQRREQEDMTRQQQATFATHVKEASTYLASNEADYPIIAALPWAGQHLVSQAYANKTRDLSKIASDLEKSVSTDFLLVLKNEKSRKALIKSDPELAKALGIGAKPAETAPEPAPIKGKGAQSPSKLPTEVTPPASTKGLKGKDRNRAAAAGLAEWIRNNRKAG